MTLRIGIVSEYCYPLLGGISENVYHTAAELTTRGHSVTIVSGAPRANGTAFLPHPNGIPTVRIGRSIPISGNGAVAHFAIGRHLWRDLDEVLTEGRFDILQLHSPLFFTLPPLAALLGRCPRIGTFHSYFETTLAYKAFGPLLQRHVVNRLQGVTVVSPSVLRALSRYFEIDARLVPNGVDTSAFHPGVPRLPQFGPDKRTLLFLGRFDPRNRLPLMLRSFELVRRRMPDVRLVVVGSGPLEAQYKRMVPDDLRPDVHFVGPALLDRPAYYATADVFCSPIANASFGITLLEAMASGVPIVATENVGYRDLLNPDEGLLVPHSESAFADAIVRVLHDQALRAEMRAAGLRKVRQYTWPVVVDRLLDYFNEILARQ